MSDKHCSHGGKETEPSKGVVENLVETAVDAATGVLGSLLGVDTKGKK